MEQMQACATSIDGTPWSVWAGCDEGPVSMLLSSMILFNSRWDHTRQLLCLIPVKVRFTSE